MIFKVVFAVCIALIWIDLNYLPPWLTERLAALEPGKLGLVIAAQFGIAIAGVNNVVVILDLLRSTPPKKRDSRAVAANPAAYHAAAYDAGDPTETDEPTQTDEACPAPAAPAPAAGLFTTPKARARDQWYSAHTPRGTPYYHNGQTGAVQWEAPAVEPRAAAAAPAAAAGARPPTAAARSPQRWPQQATRLPLKSMPGAPHVGCIPSPSRSSTPPGPPSARDLAERRMLEQRVYVLTEALEGLTQRTTDLVTADASMPAPQRLPSPQRVDPARDEALVRVDAELRRAQHVLSPVLKFKATADGDMAVMV